MTSHAHLKEVISHPQYLTILSNLAKLTSSTLHLSLQPRINQLVTGASNKREFADELNNTNWDDISDPDKDTNTSFSKFYNKVTKLLDEMAPYKKLTKKEIKLQQKPWITRGILNSMSKRDIFHKDFVTEKDPAKKPD